MSIHVMSWLWQTSPLKGTDLLLMLAVADVADDDGSNCYLGRKALAAKTRMSERQVIRVCNKLVEQGHLIHEGRSYRNTNQYRIPGVPAKGDKLAPPRRRARAPKGDIPPMGGDRSDQGGDIDAPKGDKSGQDPDIAMSPNSSLDPSFDSSSKSSLNPAGARDFQSIKDQTETTLRIANDPKAFPPSRKAARKQLEKWGIPVDDVVHQDAPPSLRGGSEHKASSPMALVS